MIQPSPGFARIAFLQPVSPAGLPEAAKRCGAVFECGKCIMAGCLLLSLVLHGLSSWLFAFRPVREFVTDRLLILDIVTSRAAAVPAPLRAAVPETASPVSVSPSVVPAARIPSPAPAPKAKAAPERKPGDSALHRKPKVQEPAVKAVRPGKDEQRVGAGTLIPVGQVVPKTGVTVLANESGQDALKHGSEARFMHGVATEEFVEENYIGEYSLGKLGRVWIEDDRARSGHLILHVEGIGLTRPLFRFNRFIYVYGEQPDSPEPILGSVTFFSDGDRIHQFLMQHNATHAYYPRRN